MTRATNSMIRRRLALILMVTLLLGCNGPGDGNTSLPPPLVDGDISDFVELGIEPIKVSDEVNLYVYQDQYFVWLGYAYPEGSFGTLDMLLYTPKLADTLDLHVSAQVGEWPANRRDLAPENPQSEKWWNMKGWIANEVWPNGMNRTDSTAFPRFKNGRARELQIGKKRFGNGTWQFQLHIRSIKKGEESYSLKFPTDSTFYSLEVY